MRSPGRSPRTCWVCRGGGRCPPDSLQCVCLQDGAVSKAPDMSWAWIDAHRKCLQWPESLLGSLNVISVQRSWQCAEAKTLSNKHSQLCSFTRCHKVWHQSSCLIRMLSGLRGSIWQALICLAQVSDAVRDLLGAQQGGQRHQRQHRARAGPATAGRRHGSRQEHCARGHRPRRLLEQGALTAEPCVACACKCCQVTLMS